MFLIRCRLREDRRFLRGSVRDEGFEGRWKTMPSLGSDSLIIARNAIAGLRHGARRSHRLHDAQLGHGQEG